MSYRPDHLLACEHLAVGYLKGKIAQRLIEDFSAKCQIGTLTCLLGVNGAGKSSLLRTLVGLQKPLEGNIFIKEQNLYQIKPAFVAQLISWVSTQNLPVGSMSVKEFVALGRYPYTNWLGHLKNNDKTAIEKAFELTNTADFRDRPLYSLSDGERQRVTLAKALAQDTPCIVLDEPTAHLDLPTRVQLIELLKRLSQEAHKAIILSTHELHLALEYTDKVWLVHQKRIFEGTPQDNSLIHLIETAFQYQLTKF